MPCVTLGIVYRQGRQGHPLRLYLLDESQGQGQNPPPPSWPLQKHGYEGVY